MGGWWRDKGRIVLHGELDLPDRGGGLLQRIAGLQARFQLGANRATDGDETVAAFILPVVGDGPLARLGKFRLIRRQRFTPEQHQAAIRRGQRIGHRTVRRELLRLIDDLRIPAETGRDLLGLERRNGFQREFVLGDEIVKGRRVGPELRW